MSFADDDADDGHQVDQHHDHDDDEDEDGDNEYEGKAGVAAH